jgi:hypothetical protein
MWLWWSVASVAWALGAACALVTRAVLTKLLSRTAATLVAVLALLLLLLLAVAIELLLLPSSVSTMLARIGMTGATLDTSPLLAAGTFGAAFRYVMVGMSMVAGTSQQQQYSRQQQRQQQAPLLHVTSVTARWCTTALDENQAPQLVTDREVVLRGLPPVDPEAAVEELPVEPSLAEQLAAQLSQEEVDELLCVPKVLSAKETKVVRKRVSCEQARLLTSVDFVRAIADLETTTKKRKAPKPKAFSTRSQGERRRRMPLLLLPLRLARQRSRSPLFQASQAARMNRLCRRHLLNGLL